ncbi:MAG: PAS domain S-box protein, partial [Deltaproteobacteria bacterium]|nr:PAS domain S-box protein [Deltaproteobacteria bacterium]
NISNNQVYFNPRYYTMLGYEPYEFKSNFDGWRNLLHPHDAPDVLKQLFDYIEQRSSTYELEFRLRAKSGQWRWVLSRGKVVAWDDDGKPVRMIGTHTDITDRKTAVTQLRDALERLKKRENELTMLNRQLVEREDEIRESKDVLENIFSTTADGIIVADSQGRIVNANKAMENILGFQANELVGKYTMQLCLQEEKHLGVGLAMLEQASIDGNVNCLEAEWVRKDGSLCPVEFNVTFIKNEAGEISTGVGSVRDITERKRSEQELLTYQEKLRSLSSELLMAAERERRRIATDLHDRIGQALAITKIKLGALCKPAASFGLSMEFETLRELLSQTIEDTRSLTFEISPPVLYELGLEVAFEWLAEQTYKKNGLKCKVEDDDQEKPLDDLQKATLFQAVQEFVVNIVKHAQATRACISVSRADKLIEISVSDNGIGINTEVLAATARAHKGFGLFSVKERLSLIGGEFSIAAEPGNGTTVCITAPLVRAESRA